MGSLFEILPEASSSPQLKAAAAGLVSDALFHEENLEGYREALLAAEVEEAAAAAAAAAAVGTGGAGAGVGGSATGEETSLALSPPVAGEGGKKKRKRRNARGEGDGAGDGVGDGGGTKLPRRVCYQQQLLEEMASLAGSKSESARRGAIFGAPLLLQGFIVRLGRAQRDTADIHKTAGMAAAAAISAAGGKRSRGSGPASHSGGGGGTSGGGNSSSSLSPAAQMFKLWAVLTSTLSAPPSAPSTISTRGEKNEVGCKGATVSARAVAVHTPPSSRPPTPSLLRMSLPPSLVLAFLRSSNSMLGLLAAHDVYRISEDWGGVEFDRLRSFSCTLIDLAASREGGEEGEEREEEGKAGSDGGGDATVIATAAATAAISFTEARRAAAQEFIVAFQSLLRLNHNILHDDLRPVLRMTFQWAAAAAAAGAEVAAATAPEEYSKVTTAAAAAAAAATAPTAADGGCDDGDSRGASGAGRDAVGPIGASDGGGSGGHGGHTLRTQAVGLVVSLVDTYGRLRQMDHLVQALFGAIVDRPSAAADVLRSGECTAALGR